MVNVLALCYHYKWSIEYVLDLPFPALSAIIKNTERVLNVQRIEALRIALASGSTRKYQESLMKHYSDGAAPERPKPKAVNTIDAFQALKGLMRG